MFLLGDFNSQPGSQTYNEVLKAGFKSAYATVHGQEPEITFPTGLQAEFMDTDPAMCLDYIFYRGPDTLQPTSASLAGNVAHPNDSTIYPSDHMALVCDFKF